MEPSLRTRSIPASATLAISAKAGRLKAAGVDVVDLSVGQPDFPTPEHIVEAARKALADKAFGYTPTAGTPKLREAVAQNLSAATGLKLAPANVFVSSGAKQCLHNLMQALVDPGDEVLVPAPYWVSYPSMVHAAQGVMRVLPTCLERGFRIDAQQLREALTDRSRLLVLNTPSNPTGAAYSEEELRALGEVVLSHPRLLVLSDEIYRGLTYDGWKHVSPASLGQDLASRCFLVDGVSKAYAMTGWRIGYAAGDPEVIAAAIRYQDHTTSCPSSISQAAALAALTGPQEPVEEMRRAFEKRRRALIEQVASMQGLSLSPPQGAFYGFLRLEARAETDVALCERLIDEAHVAAVPGTAFGAPSHIRVSFATSTDRLREGLARIGRALCGPV